MLNSEILLQKNPFVVFDVWFEEAKKSEIKYHDAFTVSTLGEDGFPCSRVVLLKHWDERGFVFYTNFRGAKGREILANPFVSMCFYWKSTDRQVRIRGAVEVVTEAEADAYFHSRPRDSQIGAWASNQSQEISGRDELLAKFHEFSRKFEGQEVPRPPHWSGFRVIPQSFEFWLEGGFRLHDRHVFERVGDGWKRKILSP